MIPPLERSTFYNSIARAWEHGRRGELAEGYEELRFGMGVAEDLALMGEAWATAVADRYRRAMREYIVDFGVRME